MRVVTPRSVLAARRGVHETPTPREWPTYSAASLACRQNGQRVVNHLLIEPLDGHTDLVDLTVDWHMTEFDPDGDRDFWLRARRAEARSSGIPCAWIALLDDVPVGCVSLIASNMDAHRELSPWLAALFVLPDHRHQGIGRALVERCEHETWSLGVDQLYLFTERPPARAWYVQLGWRDPFTDVYEDRPVTVMVRESPSSTKLI